MHQCNEACVQGVDGGQHGDDGSARKLHGPQRGHDSANEQLEDHQGPPHRVENVVDVEIPRAFGQDISIQADGQAPGREPPAGGLHHVVRLRVPTVANGSNAVGDTSPLRGGEKAGARSLAGRIRGYDLVGRVLASRRRTRLRARGQGLVGRRARQRWRAGGQCRLSRSRGPDVGRLLGSPAVLRAGVRTSVKMLDMLGKAEQDRGEIQTKATTADERR